MTTRIVNRPIPSLVCFALQQEAGAFLKLAARRAEIAILFTGMGRVNAEKSIRRFFEHNCAQSVFTCGFAGGLNPTLKTGDVVFATDDELLRVRLADAGAGSARLVCVPRIVVTAQQKAELFRATGADAVEMESEAIRAVCRERGIPCATVRAISDPAPEDLPLDFNLLSKPDLNLDYGRLALMIAKSPGKVPALLRLQRNCKFAAERLAHTLAAVLALG